MGEAVTQMDQATQQNAALVEQMAAAASSLKAQAGEMVAAVAVFKVAGKVGLVKSSVRSPTASSTSFRGEDRRAMKSHILGLNESRRVPAKPWN